MNPINNNLRTLDLSKLTPHSVGFDKLFNNMFQYVDHQTANAGYPPYNILRDGDYFTIEIALAGVRLEDLDIELKENILTISHVPTEEEPSETLQWIHKGIAQRKFTRHFTLADDVVVLGANMVNGMLYVDLQRIVPEEKKPRKITIAQNK
jgi:molecular chaperone IbpA